MFSEKILFKVPDGYSFKTFKNERRICLNLNIKAKAKKLIMETRNPTKTQITALRNDLYLQNWESVISLNNVNKAACRFEDIKDNLIKKHIHINHIN